MDEATKKIFKWEPLVRWAEDKWHANNEERRSLALAAKTLKTSMEEHIAWLRENKPSPETSILARKEYTATINELRRALNDFDNLCEVLEEAVCIKSGAERQPKSHKLVINTLVE